MPGIRREFLAAIRHLVSTTDYAAVEQAMLRGDVQAAYQAIPWDTFEQGLKAVRRELERIALEAHQGAVAELGQRAAAGEIQLSPSGSLRIETFDQVVSQYVLDYLRNESATLIQGLVAETQYAVRAALTNAHQRGLHPRQAARELRQIIGLNQRQQEAVDALRQSLIADEVPPARIEQLVEAYIVRQKRIRSEVVARTETITALNRGQQSAWVEAQDRGEIVGDRWEQEWVAIVPSDGRTCPICELLDGKRAPIGGTFPNGLLGPTAHPQCRCTTRLVRVAA